MDHDGFKVGCAHLEAVGLGGGGILGVDQRLQSTVAFPAADEKPTNTVAGSSGFATDGAIGAGELPPGRAGEDPALVDVGDGVGTFLQIGHDLGREQDAGALFGDDITEHIKQVVAGNGIEAAGGFVQENQLGSVRQRQRHRVFDAHALGEFVEFLGLDEFETLQQATVGGLIPGPEEPAEHVGDVPDPFLWIEVHLPEGKGDAFLDLQFVAAEIEPEKLDTARVGMDEVQHRLQRRRFSRAIPADESHDGAGLHRE